MPLSSTALVQRSKPVILIYFLDPGGFGGMQKCLTDLAVGLQQNGTYHPVVLCVQGYPFYDKLKQLGIETYGIPLPNFLPPFLRKHYGRQALLPIDGYTYYHIKQVLDRVRPDLVHVNAGRIENMCFKVWGYKTVYVHHGYGEVLRPHLQSSAIKRQFNGLMKHGFRYMASHIDEMVFVSRAEQERLIADGFVPPANRGRVIHNGLDVTAFIERVNRTDVAKKRHEQGLNPATKVVLFPARLDQENNSLAFFDFYREFMARDSGLNVHFLVAGNGHYGDYFESELKQAPYSANISFLGYREDIPELLAASDALLTLTLAEAFGIRVLEGMAAGVPAIGYGTGGIPELLEGTGAMEYLASVGDISEAVDKAIALLQRLTSEPESKASFVQTLQQRASLFTMEAFLQGYLQLYNDCLTQGRE